LFRIDEKTQRPSCRFASLTCYFCHVSHSCA
jgi:hypothetical protein